MAADENHPAVDHASDIERLFAGHLPCRGPRAQIEALQFLGIDGGQHDAAGSEDGRCIPPATAGRRPSASDRTIDDDAAPACESADLDAHAEPHHLRGLLAGYGIVGGPQ